MTAEDFARELKKTIEEEKARGISTIPCDSLIAYLDEVLKNPSVPVSPAELEHFKAQLQEENESNLEMFRSVITSGQNALRSGFLLNGGAAVALLAFISHLATTQPTRVSVFTSSLLIFVFGVFLISLASFTTYLCQWFYSGQVEIKDSKRIGFWFNIITIILGFSSVIVFLWGMYSAYVGFKIFG